MDKSYKVRGYKTGDEHGLINLLGIVFKKWPHFDIKYTQVEHWLWKYKDNPIKSRTTSLAEDNDLMVGSNHGVPRKVKLYNQTILSSQGTDLATHPEYRRKGIYRKISEFKTKLYEKEKCGFTYAVTGNPIVIDTNMKWGRRGFPHKLSTLVRVKDIDLHLEVKQTDDLIKKIGAKFIIKTSEIRHQFDKYFKQDEVKLNIRIGIVKRFDTSYLTFWNTVRNSYDFIFERGIDYMNWRFCDPRGGEYQVLMAKKEEMVLGYIVLRINRAMGEYPEGYIVDLLTLPDRYDVASSLVKEANKYFDSHEVNIVHVWAINGNPYEEVLKRNEYNDSRYEPFVIFQNISLTESWDTIFKIPASRMHLQYSDSDWI